MARCEVKTGFMVLRDCENEATENCSVCGKHVCFKHKRFHPKTQQVCCIDCYAKNLDEEAVNELHNLPQDENHCCICGKEVSASLDDDDPDKKIVDSKTKKVYCQGCYDDVDEEGNVQRTLGTALLGRSMYDDDYWYGYRSHYYHHHHYRPFHKGNVSNFDESEVRAFNPKNNPMENGQLDDSNNKDNAFDS